MNRWKNIKFKIQKYLVIFLQLFTKKNTYILFDNLYEKNVECIDTYCIFQYMQKNNIKSYYIAYKENPMYKEILQNNKNVIVIKKSVHDPESFEFFSKIWKILPKTKAVITSFGDVLNLKITNFLYKNRYINYIHVDHGSVFLKTFVVTTDYFSCKKYNKFIVSNPIEQEIFMQNGWQKENLPIIGLPRWAALRKQPQQQKTIFVMFTWRTSFGRWNTNKYKIPLKETMYYKNILSFLTNSNLNALLKKHNIKLVYTLHHALIDQCPQGKEISISNIEYIPATNISQYIGKTDLFITDYSSIFFDFAFLNTPIVFYRPDFNDNTLLALDQEDMAHSKSMDKYLFNCCYEQETAIKCIEKYIKNDFVLEKENIEKLDALFPSKHNIMQNFIKYLKKL